ncbi:MAG: c-type cytochrome biogenesis protein CcmI [Pseudomonadota bacterium]
MGFWIIILGLTVLCCAVLARAVMQRGGAQSPAAAYDLQVYRDQLKDVEKDLARGVISEEDAERLRTEVSRRILAADAKLRDAKETKEARKSPSLPVLLVVMASILGGSLWIYRELGAPGLDDLPLAARIAASDEARANRLSQAEVEAQLTSAPEVEVDPSYLELVEQLRSAVASRPGDAQGLALLARHEAGIGNFQAAHQAQLQLLQSKGVAATAEDFATLADLMVSAARGYVSADAEKALRAALARDRNEPRAQYYLGVYMLQVDRPDAAFRLWSDLLEESDMQDPWTPTVLNRIGEVALRAGVQYDLPDMPGQATPEMISDMVASLSARLATQGGTAEEWARLIRSHGVLGNTDQARAIWTEAQAAFENDDAAITLLRSAADSAGVLE